MQIVGDETEEAQSLCSLAACRWRIASVAGLEAAEAIAGEELIAWQAKMGGRVGLYTIIVSALPTWSIY